MWNWILSAYIIFLPFQFALNPAEDVDLAIGRIIGIIIIVLWCANSLAKKTLLFPNQLSFWFGTTFFILAGFSLFWADNGAWAIRKFIFLLSIFPLFFVSSSLARKNRISAQTIFSFAALSGAVSACVALAQFFAQFLFGLNTVLNFWREYIAPFFLGVSFSEAVNNFPSWLVNISGETLMRAVAFFPDPHIAAFFWELTLPIAVILFLKTKRKLFLLASILIFFALIFTFSRGAYIALSVGLFVFLLHFFLKNPLALASKKTLFALLITVSIVFVGIKTFGEPLLNRLKSSFDMHEGSNEGRFAMWQEGIRVFSEHPASGVGLGNFPLEVKPSAEYREPIYAHNTYLDIAAETGIFSVLFWIAWLTGLAVTFLHRSKTDPVFIAGVYAILLFSVHALFDTPLYSVHTLPLLCILFGLAFSEESAVKLFTKNTKQDR